MLYAGEDLCYSDTDSLYIANGKKLPDRIVGTALGQYKIEHENATFVGYAPKVYMLEAPSEKTTYIRVKGIPSRKAKRVLTLLKNKKYKAISYWNLASPKIVMRGQGTLTNHGFLSEVKRKRTVAPNDDKRPLSEDRSKPVAIWEERNTMADRREVGG
jgi:hypothetical protein